MNTAGQPDLPPEAPASVYASVIANPCPTCQAGTGELCRNAVTKRPRRIPCLSRINQRTARTQKWSA